MRTETSFDLDKILSEATSLIVSELGPDLIVFHGSRLWGDPYPDSDIDLLVVKKTDKNLMQRSEEVERLLRKIKAPVEFDVQIWTPEEVRQGLECGHTYVGLALAGGRVLFQKEKKSMVPKEHFYNIEAWLEDARICLQHAKDDLGRGWNRSSMDQLFQSTERYLKAYLMTKNTRVEMTHNLSTLFDHAIKFEPSWEKHRTDIGFVYEWGRACHYSPRPGEKQRIVPTLSEVGDLHKKITPWLSEIDRKLSRTQAKGKGMEI